MNRFSNLFLVVTLLLSQFALLEQEYGVGAYDSEDTWSICLHAAPLSDGIVGMDAMGSMAMRVLPMVVGRSEFYARDVRVAKVMDVVYHSRAPPLVSPA